jgi:hypothetical protein
MTPKQTAYQKVLIKDIQINKRNVFVDDEQRREFMLSRFGKESTKELSIAQLKQLLNFCLRKVSDVVPNIVTEPQVHKIEKLWSAKARDKSAIALLLFAKRICKRAVYDLRVIQKEEATKIILALERLKL